ncbi:hypothetical protein GCM10022225_18610 [Plantactinospora mayteni]
MSASRRLGQVLAVAVALAVTAGAALAGGRPAQAASPPCGQEHASFAQTTADGRGQGPSSDSLYGPQDVYLSDSDPEWRYLLLYGQHRPDRTILFTFSYANGILFGSVEISAPTVIPWAGPVGSRLLVHAVLHTRCGGDDVPRRVYVGAINTTP